MTTATHITAIVINGARWFDRINGNTYHATRTLVVDSAGNLEEYTTGFAYGYGDQYVESAREELHNQGVLEYVRDGRGLSDPLWRVCRERGIELSRRTIDVATRRELEEFAPTLEEETK